VALELHHVRPKLETGYKAKAPRRIEGLLNCILSRLSGRDLNDRARHD
jgi:hypothetical protein